MCLHPHWMTTGTWVHMRTSVYNTWVISRYCSLWTTQRGRCHIPDVQIEQNHRCIAIDDFTFYTSEQDHHIPQCKTLHLILWEYHRRYQSHRAWQSSHMWFHYPSSILDLILMSPLPALIELQSLSHPIFRVKPSAYLYACQDQVSCI
jgi:hypothetical protein